MKTRPTRQKAPEMCPKGKTLRKQRADAVNKAPVEKWYVVEGKSWLKYCRHVTKCETCMTYYRWKYPRTKELDK
jgi:hypothetical protein